MPLIPALLAAFKVWMLYDVAIRYPRCCGNMWFYIVLIPGGDFIYFFMVKVHDPEMRRFFGSLFTRPTSLEQLEFQAEHCPSENNRLIYAQALFDAARYQDAREIFEKILKQDSGNKSALLGAGLCDFNLDSPDRALTRLKSLADMDFGYKEFRGPLEVIEFLKSNGRASEAREWLERLVKKSATLEHIIALAETMIECGEKEAAHDLVTRRINAEKVPGANIQRASRATIKRARELLENVDVSSS